MQSGESQQLDSKSPSVYAMGKVEQVDPEPLAYVASAAEQVYESVFSALPSLQDSVSD
jgi:hypothetical protein